VTQVASNRTQVVRDEPVRPDGAYVLYWMLAQRRTASNFALERAAAWAETLKRPLLVFEPLRVGYRWASDRLHRFVIEGMADNAARCAAAGVRYFPYVEPTHGAARGLLSALSAQAAVVVTDDYPAFIIPGLIAAAARAIPVRLESVDSVGLLPMRSTDEVFATAYAFRRHLQRVLPGHVTARPTPDPLEPLRGGEMAAIDPAVTKRWPAADLEGLLAPGGLSSLPIDHTVAPVAMRGGSESANRSLERFLDERLAGYADDRNDVNHDVTSGLSPFLHFGHISSHDVFWRLMQREGWLGDLSRRANGAREGWWGVSAPAEAFLDQLITWRELGFNMCAHRSDYDRYESLPGWARTTLARHATDRRDSIYTLETFERAQTHDALWNAAQGQLVAEGRIHNYLRMLWGKKVLEWTATPEDALAVLIELNNKYAIDGRDPNSYSGIFWTLGRYDRPWGPERPIFGTVRYMSSANTTRKMNVRGYIARYAPGPPQPSLFGEREAAGA